MDINPYEAPRSEILHAADGYVELAARLRRLAAVMIDTVCLVLAWLAAEWMLSRAGIEFAAAESDEDIWSSMWAFEPAYDAFGFAVYLLIQGPLLATRAQTIGKILLQIRIVDMRGAKGSFARIVLPRIPRMGREHYYWDGPRLFPHRRAADFPLEPSLHARSHRWHAGCHGALKQRRPTVTGQCSAPAASLRSSCVSNATCSAMRRPRTTASMARPGAPGWRSACSGE